MDTPIANPHAILMDVEHKEVGRLQVRCNLKSLADFDAEVTLEELEDCCRQHGPGRYLAYGFHAQTNRQLPGYRKIIVAEVIEDVPAQAERPVDTSWVERTQLELLKDQQKERERMAVERAAHEDRLREERKEHEARLAAETSRLEERRAEAIGNSQQMLLAFLEREREAERARLEREEQRRVEMQREREQILADARQQDEALRLRQEDMTVRTSHQQMAQVKEQQETLRADFERRLEHERMMMEHRLKLTREEHRLEMAVKEAELGPVSGAIPKELRSEWWRRYMDEALPEQEGLARYGDLIRQVMEFVQAGGAGQLPSPPSSGVDPSSGYEPPDVIRSE